MLTCNLLTRPTEEVREIAAKGGHASHTLEAEIPQAGGGNPGNFANR